MQLVTHLQSAAAAERLRVQAAADVVGRSAHFEFSIEGDITELAWPAAGLSLRQDGLWHHTCFEAFLAIPGATRYYEFNFAPSGSWAAYEFADYRSEMRVLELAMPPQIEARLERDRARLQARLDLAPLLKDEADGRFELALAAVIERGHGTRSYWALRHGGEQPDFHRRDGFAMVFAIRSPTLRT